MRRLLIWLTVFPIAVVVSCNPDEMIAPGVDPEFLIQDGAHRGNAHFFFLPPLVPPARYSGVPDGTLQPEVTVCPLIGGSCGASIARFTTAPAANTLQQIRFTASLVAITWSGTPEIAWLVHAPWMRPNVTGSRSALVMRSWAGLISTWWRKFAS